MAARCKGIALTCCAGLLLICLPAGAVGQQSEERSGSLASALGSALSLFHDLKRAWDENVTFPASKEQLTTRLTKLHASLQSLRQAILLVTDDLAVVNPATVSPEQRRRNDERLQALLDRVSEVRNGLGDLRSLLPPAFAEQGSAVLEKLEAGLSVRGQTLQRLSQKLTGQREFDAVLVQQEGNKAAEIAGELARTVETFRLAVESGNH